MHAVLWLIMAFFNAAGLMLLVGAEFIAMLLVIVYVGAVAVLFLFVVMMLDIDFAELRAGLMRYAAVGVLLALMLVCRYHHRDRRLYSLSSFYLALSCRTDRPEYLPISKRSSVFSTPAISSSSKARGFVLLLAMIVAIVLTHRNRGRHPRP